MAKKQKLGLEEIIESPEALAQELGKAQTFAETKGFYLFLQMFVLYPTLEPMLLDFQ